MNGRRAKIIRRQARASAGPSFVRIDPRSIRLRYRRMKKAWTRQHPKP